MDEPPLRQFFGEENLPMMEAEYASRLAEWREGNDRTIRAFGSQVR